MKKHNKEYQDDRHLGSISFQLSQKLTERFWWSWFDINSLTLMTREVYLSEKTIEKWPNCIWLRGLGKIIDWRCVYSRSLASVRNLLEQESRTVSWRLRVYPKFSFLEIINLIEYLDLFHWFHLEWITFKVYWTNWLSIYEKDFTDFGSLSYDDFFVVTHREQQIFLDEEESLAWSLWSLLVYLHSVYSKRDDFNEFISQF